ncbi:sigma-70 family RNA polymerase sigma factor [Nocardia spumae]|uniref:sigma-70 family RNA polymerase sigma factor n=1 Tax=Nocardia spumae TaxID=2887190 RepID=UPI001D13D40D|nr:sigma-70 family RNA polymerase sigma factor [Nocardia spumae]
MADRAELFRRLQFEHRSALCRYANVLTRDHGQREEIVQETFVRAWLRPEVLDQSGISVRAWLCTVARNLAIDAHRSARNRRELPTATVPERARGPDEFGRVLDSCVLADALGSLDIRQRVVIVLAYFEGRSTDEIATELDIPPGTVKSRMHFGVARLRQSLRDLGVNGSVTCA